MPGKSTLLLRKAAAKAATLFERLNHGWAHKVAFSIHSSTLTVVGVVAPVVALAVLEVIVLQSKIYARHLCNAQETFL